MAFLKTGYGGNGGGGTPSYDHYEFDITGQQVTTPWGTGYIGMATYQFGKTYNNITSIEANFASSNSQVTFVGVDSFTNAQATIVYMRLASATTKGKLSINVYGN